eukprot:2774254-Amphidinium_carterae.1
MAFEKLKQQGLRVLTRQRIVKPTTQRQMDLERQGYNTKGPKGKGEGYKRGKGDIKGNPDPKGKGGKLGK